jgi:hypothetical protein
MEVIDHILSTSDFGRVIFVSPSILLINLKGMAEKVMFIYLYRSFFATNKEFYFLKKISYRPLVIIKHIVSGIKVLHVYILSDS